MGFTEKVASLISLFHFEESWLHRCSDSRAGSFARHRPCRRWRLRRSGGCAKGIVLWPASWLLLCSPPPFPAVNSYRKSVIDGNSTPRLERIRNSGHMKNEIWNKWSCIRNRVAQYVWYIGTNMPLLGMHEYIQHKPFFGTENCIDLENRFATVL